MKVGIQISSVRKYLQTPEDVTRSFLKCAEIGYKYIQIQWVGENVTMQEIKNSLDVSGLVCIGTQEMFDTVNNDPESFIKMNDLWGSEYITASRIHDRFRTPEGCLRLADEMNKLAANFKTHGKKLLFHPVAADYEQCGGKPLVDILMENTAPEIHYCLDIYHVYKAGLDPTARIKTLKGNLELVHFKDSGAPPGGNLNDIFSKLTPVGQGVIDWPPIISACVDSGVRYCFAEQEEWDKDPFECLRESYEYIEKGITGNELH